MTCKEATTVIQQTATLTVGTLYILTFAVNNPTTGCTIPYPSNSRVIYAQATGSSLVTYTYSVTPMNSAGTFAANPFFYQYYFIPTQASTTISIGTPSNLNYDCGPYVDNVALSPIVRI